jgi:hypothetical protein
MRYAYWLSLLRDALVILAIVYVLTIAVIACMS